MDSVISKEFKQINLQSSVPISLQLGPDEYTVSSDGHYHVNMNQPLRTALVSMNRLEFVPSYPTVVAGTTGSIVYNSVTYNFTVPTGAYSFAQLSNEINQIQLANNLYLVNPLGQTVVFINLSLATNNELASLVINPVPASLPSGFTNPGGLVLTGDTPTISFSTALSTLLGGFASSPYPATPQTSSQTFFSSALPLNIFFNYKVMMLMPRTVLRYFPTSATPCLYQGFAMFSGDGIPVTVEPLNRSWFSFANSGMEQHLEFAITDQSNLPIVLSDPNLVLSLDFIFKEDYL